jgi:MerR family transcriptional regulator, thiopeptide resistance regulator
MNYSARKFAELTGVTIKALRHYEHRGLLAPHRDGAGYRRYSLYDLQRLEQILALKSLGLPLAHISPLAKAPDVAALCAQRTRLADARARIDSAIAALDRIANADDPAAALRRFVMNTSWERWELKRRDASNGISRPPDRVSASRRALFHDIAAALESGDLSEDAAQSLRTRWDALLDAETCGQADVKAALARVMHLRIHWPDGVKRYVASMYEMEPEAWERVAQFIDTGPRSD